MRVAAIEDKLAQMNVTEEEMRAYQKVASLMAGRAAPAPMIPQLCTTCSNCVIAIPVSVSPISPVHHCAIAAQAFGQTTPLGMPGAAGAAGVGVTPASGGVGFAGLGTG
jgi:Na+-translocating ferredoxin:NAD+ oxidoreductase RNF subunit RnfB